MQMTTQTRETFFFCFLIIYLFSLFIFGYTWSLLLPGLFSSCGEWGDSLVAVHGLLIAMASLVVEHRL